MEFFPAWYWPFVFFLLGAIVGSFLNVYLYRFHTGRSLGGNSHCLSCGRPLRWFELVPIFSYLALRGRCRTCHAQIPARYALVELLTATLFLVAYVSVGFSLLLPLYLMLGVLLVLIVVYDIYHYIIPNEFVLALGGVAAAYVLVRWYAVGTLTPLIAALGGAGVSVAVIGGLWLISRGRWMGFGDVKLVVPLGALVGLAGSYSFIILSFWIGALVSLVLLSWLPVTEQIRVWWVRLAATAYTYPRVAKKRRYLTMKSEVPFAPFLIAGFVAVFFFSVDVLHVLFYAF